MPLYHEDNLLAVIGITGSPEKVRKYAFLAQRITSLLIREQELSQYSQHQQIRSILSSVPCSMAMPEPGIPSEMSQRISD